jgi:hypothetical protein
LVRGEHVKFTLVRGEEGGDGGRVPEVPARGGFEGVDRMVSGLEIEASVGGEDRAASEVERPVPERFAGGDVESVQVVGSEGHEDTTIIYDGVVERSGAGGKSPERDGEESEESRRHAGIRVKGR